MFHEAKSNNQDITGYKILTVDIPDALKEPFRVADSLAQGEFYLIGSAVRRCILGESEYPDDADFLGDFDLDYLEKFFGDNVIGKANKEGRTTKVLHGNQELDFISDTNIRANLAERDMTISLMCMDKNGAIYDPFNYINDLRDKRIRIVDADRKIQIEPWRIIRVLRFAASLGFEVEDLTRQACIKNANLLNVENTTYVISKLLNASGEVTEGVLRMAEDYGISSYVNNLITGGSKDD